MLRKFRVVLSNNQNDDCPPERTIRILIGILHTGYKNSIRCPGDV